MPRFQILENRGKSFKCYLLFVGPDLEKGVHGHSMVPLEFGQVILGGNEVYWQNSKNIQLMTCSQEICVIERLNRRLSYPRSGFVVIPIPDSMSGCTSKSKF